MGAKSFKFASKFSQNQGFSAPDLHFRLSNAMHMHWTEYKTT